MPNSTMTNANIESAVASADGQELVLEIQGRREEVYHADECRGGDVCSGDGMADLKPGEKIFVLAGKKIDRGHRRSRDVMMVGHRRH